MRIRRRTRSGLLYFMTTSAMSLSSGIPCVYGADYITSLSVENRYFWRDGLYQDAGNFSAVKGTLETQYGFNDEQIVVDVSVNGRWDINDTNGTYFDPNVAKISYFADNWSISAGYDVVFWGVVESTNIVNVINQTNFFEDLSGDEKFGQPMLAWERESDAGFFELYALFGSMPRKFTSEDGRLTLPFIVGQSQYESEKKDERVDIAGRWSHSYYDVDFAVSFFSGVNRTPYFSIDEQSVNDTSRAISLIAFYDNVDQVGLELQYIYEGFIFKSETAYQTDSQDSFLSAVVGGEYNVIGVFDTSVDVGMFIEYMHDERQEDALPGIFASDLLLAAKIYLNNEASTSIQASALVDEKQRETLFTVEIEHRLNANLTLSADLRLFDTGPSLSRNEFIRLQEFAAQEDTNLHNFLNDEEHITVTLQYYFQ